MLHLDWQVWRLRHRVEAATAEIHYWTALRKSMPHHLSAARERARLASNRITRILDLRDTLGTHPRDEARRAAQQFEAARVLRHWRAPAANEPTANPAHDMAWLAEQQAHLTARWRRPKHAATPRPPACHEPRRHHSSCRTDRSTGAAAGRPDG